MLPHAVPISFMYPYRIPFDLLHTARAALRRCCALLHTTVCASRAQKHLLFVSVMHVQQGQPEASPGTAPSDVAPEGGS